MSTILNAAPNTEMQTQLILFITGAEKGIFMGEGGKEIAYGSVYGGQALAGDNAIGYKVDKYKAESHVFDIVKTAKLPAQFLCRVTMRQMGVSGMAVRVLDAVPFEYQPPKAK